MTVGDHERVVFDAEPLVAHADDEPGSETVESVLDAVAVDDVKGLVSHVTLTEVRYILARKYDRSIADQYIEWLQNIGLQPVDVADVWSDAAAFVLEYGPALGDSFALATAHEHDALLVVGADDDYDEITDVALERFRDEPA